VRAEAAETPAGRWGRQQGKAPRRLSRLCQWVGWEASPTSPVWTRIPAASHKACRHPVRALALRMRVWVLTRVGWDQCKLGPGPGTGFYSVA